jgi:hypothetical protein
MNSVIEFSFGKDNLLKKKYARFDELKGKEFSDILTHLKKRNIMI